MSTLALDLLELNRLCAGGYGALIEHLRLEVAMELIAAGLIDFRGGC
jgi:hypothetical protein